MKILIGLSVCGLIVLLSNIKFRAMTVRLEQRMAKSTNAQGGE